MSALHYRVLPEDPRVGFWTALAITAVLVVWRFVTVSDTTEVGGGGVTKYVLYLLPFACILVQASVRRMVVPIDPAGAQAFGLYVLVAGMAILANRTANPFLMRDVLIISTYILMFAVAWTATSREVAIMAGTCFLCMAIEALQEGVSFNVNILASDGILESVMAFPLGVIVLYCVVTRRLGLGLVTGLLFFAAYKRIAILAVLGVLAFEMAVVMLGLTRRRRALAAALVVGLAVVSLFSAPVFEYFATAIGGENVSANSISLGRFEFSQAIWREIHASSLTQLLFGQGPGSADTIVQTVIENASNPHNDWLKIFVDYGAFGFLLFQLILLRMFAGSLFGVWAYLYTAIVMTTDNALIYTFHQVIILVVIRAALSVPADGPSPLSLARRGSLRSAPLASFR